MEKKHAPNHQAVPYVPMISNCPSRLGQHEGGHGEVRKRQSRQEPGWGFLG